MEQILLIVASGVLGYEVVFSALAYHIKRLVFLDEEQPLSLLLSSFKAYKKLLGRWLIFPPALVICAVLMITAMVHRALQQLVSCPFCCSMWIGLLASLFFQYTWPIAIVNGLCAMMITSLYNLIRVKSI